MVAVLESDLLKVGVGKDLLDISVNTDKLIGLLGELFLDLSGVDEQLLQERPVTLDFTAHHDDLTDGSEGFLPFGALVLEGGKVARREHGVDLSLMLFKCLEVLFIEFEHLHVAALVLLEVELDVDPEDLNGLESLLHLGLLHGLIGDFFNVLSDLTELEVVDVAQAEVVVDDKVAVDLSADLVPMALTH